MVKPSLLHVFLIQLDRAKAVKALMSADHRRQSITASKKRRPSIHLERRGTIRRDSKLPLLDTSDGLFGRKREDSISKEVEAESVIGSISSRAGGNEPALKSPNAEPESVTEQKDEDAIVTNQPNTPVTTENTAVTTEQGPPTARVNNLFPDQQTPAQTKDCDVSQSQKEVTLGSKVDAASQSLSVLSHVPAEATNVFDSAFVKKSKWSTLRNFVYSLQPHKGGGCSHVVNEVKHIAEGSGAIPSEDQIKEQVTVMAQHAIDSESITFLTGILSVWFENATFPLRIGLPPTCKR